jgi:hypothetical protein
MKRAVVKARFAVMQSSEGITIRCFGQAEDLSYTTPTA